jgi:hypothetical protein
VTLQFCYIFAVFNGLPEDEALASSGSVSPKALDATAQPGKETPVSVARDGEEQETAAAERSQRRARSARTCPRGVNKSAVLQSGEQI